ncbi:MAG: nucleotidyltransferase family protein [Bacteroidaceae bacterium]|nr:nucleotidyltransferase family protein [Bacteroidaceae bacterium]
MKKFNHNQLAFLSLLRAGLWEKDVLLSQFNTLSYEEIYRLADEQSVFGLVAAGLEHVVDTKAPQEVVLQFVGQALQLEQRNQAMNTFISTLIERMRNDGIYTLLIKGQGVAQCYERPLWRSCGDVDLFLSEENYEKAKSLLVTKASHTGQEDQFKKHLGLTIDCWEVELHGYLRRGLSKKVNKVLDDIKDDTFYGGNVRSWLNGKTQIFLLGADNDIVYIFIHILSHFYGGGIGLRQFCDWCRLLWVYRDKINVVSLEKRLKKMGLVRVWTAFGAFAVEYLGMPSEAMPLYSPERKMKRKANRICSFILEVGNFGHNRNSSYYTKPFLIRKAISLSKRCSDVLRHTLIFPIESMRFFPYMMYNGFRAALTSGHND